MSMKTIVVTAAAFLTLGVGIGTYINYQDEQEQQEVLKQRRVQSLEIAEEAVSALYNENRTELADDINERLPEAQTAIEKVESRDKREALYREFYGIKETLNVQNQVEDLLQDKASLNKVTQEDLLEISEKLSKIIGVNKHIYTNLLHSLSIAAAQLNAIEYAEGLVQQSEGSLAREDYETAMAQVNALHGEAKKRELLERLSTVKEQVVALEEREVLAQNSEQQTSTSTSNSSQKVTAAPEQSHPSVSTNEKSSTTNIQISPESNKTQSSEKTTESTGQSKSNEGSTLMNKGEEGTKPSGSSKDSQIEVNAPESNSSRDWDQVGKELEEHDWELKDSGDIEGSGGFNWEYYE
ncbi:hypothetical protein [Pontibacillus halophilus]|uniref:hypothetical protein n=1 Tax=Pontibacillus halophilus TaxID=516704 RepID=UPI0004006164|nr:hypothetical protein [Pontibacillus halophilus]